MEGLNFFPSPDCKRLNFYAKYQIPILEGRSYVNQGRNSDIKNGQKKIRHLLWTTPQQIKLELEYASFHKVEKIEEDSLDSIPITFALCENSNYWKESLLDVVNKLLKTKSS